MKNKEFLELKNNGKSERINGEDCVVAVNENKDNVIFTCRTCTLETCCHMCIDDFSEWNGKCAYQERYVRR